jgi:hypothetical protein
MFGMGWRDVNRTTCSQAQKTIDCGAMIPLIGLLLCVYLIFKGLEILQIALCSEGTPVSGYIVAAVAVIGSILIAAFFAYAFISVGVDSPVLQP